LFVEAFVMVTSMAMKSGQNYEAEKYVQKVIDSGKGCTKA
jgi:hypothetical protein